MLNLYNLRAILSFFFVSSERRDVLRYLYIHVLHVILLFTLRESRDYRLILWWYNRQIGIMSRNYNVNYQSKIIMMHYNYNDSLTLEFTNSYMILPQFYADLA